MTIENGTGILRISKKEFSEFALGILLCVKPHMFDFNTAEDGYKFIDEFKKI